MRLEQETSGLVLEPWYDEALGICAGVAAQQLADRIRQAPPPRKRP